MSDFASALLLSLVERAASHSAEAGGSSSPPSDAWASFEAKRALLARVYVERGPASVLRIGRQVRNYGPHPTIDVLLRARDVPDLLARWQRIERFVHSHHRLAVARGDPTSMLIEHVSLDGVAPYAAEDLLILGVIVVLAELVGTRGLTASVVASDGRAAHEYRDGTWTVSPDTAADTARWHLQWSHVETPARGTAAPDLPGIATAESFVERLLDIVMDDCCRTWLVDDLAVAAHLSTRTLQRRLTEAGTTFSSLVRTAQVRLAGRLLLEDRVPVAHVGLTAGFSDQAHFTREFRRRVGVPPAKYRELFSVPARST